MSLNDLTNVPATINSGVRSAKQQTMLGHYLAIPAVLTMLIASL